MNAVVPAFRASVAAFDFDGTIIRGDSLLRFLGFCLGGPGLCKSLVLSAPALIGYGCGILSNQRAKQTLIAAALGHLTQAEVKEKGTAFARDELDRWLRPDVAARIEWHKIQGHRLVLVSASLDVYLKPWAERWGFDDCLCSEVGYGPTGHVTGTLVGGNCFGPVKAARLRRYLSGLDDSELYAYGDSRGDREMLAMAHHPVYVGKAQSAAA